MGSVHPTPLPNARAQWHTSARSSELFEGKESRAFLTMRSFAAVALLLGLVGAMEIGKGGVYDSPMAQDYYVKRFGFLFGSGRSGRHGRDEGARRGDEKQRGHLLQGSPALQGEDALEEVGNAGVAEGEGDGGARAQDDGGVQAKDVPPVHGRSLSCKKCQPNIPSVIVFQRDPK